MNTTSSKSFALTPEKRDLGGAGVVFWQISQSLTTPSKKTVDTFRQVQLACSASELRCAHVVALQMKLEAWRVSGVASPVEAAQDRPSSTLSPVEPDLRLVEVEVEVECLQQVHLLELEEVPQLQAQLLSPLVLSPQLAVSSRRLFGLYVCSGLLLAFSALKAVYTSNLNSRLWGYRLRGGGALCEGISDGSSAVAGS